MLLQARARAHVLSVRQSAYESQERIDSKLEEGGGCRFWNIERMLEPRFVLQCEIDGEKGAAEHELHGSVERG